MIALLRRAKDLEVISEASQRKIITEMNIKGFRTNEPYPISDEKPSLLSKFIDVCYKDLGYSNEDLMGIMCLNKTDYNKFFWQMNTDKFDVRKSFVYGL